MTGCSSGIGRALVPALLEAGWEVVATLRRASERGSVFDELAGAHPGRLHVLDLDVTSGASRRAAAVFVREKWGGRLELLVNNAGYGLYGAFEDLTEEELRAQFETNFFGAAALTRELLPAVRSVRGRLIFVSSVCGFAGLPFASAYAASKFALEGLAESLFHELQWLGVSVTLVEPGRFRTEFGENVAWAGSPPGTALREPWLRYRAFRERTSGRAGTGAPLAPLVRAILRAAGARRPPLRIRCGREARWFHWTRRLLGTELAVRLLGHAFRRAIR